MCIRDRSLITFSPLIALPSFIYTVSTAFILPDLTSGEPVSYTHLDVYKRQVIDGIEDEIWESAEYFPAIETLEDLGMEAKALWDNTVSYTHLDVYKRQHTKSIVTYKDPACP